MVNVTTSLDLIEAVGTCSRGPSTGMASQYFHLAPRRRRRTPRSSKRATTSFSTSPTASTSTSTPEIVGAALIEYTDRGATGLATRAFGEMRTPERSGLFREPSDVDHSLRRLGVDYADVLQIHCESKPTCPTVPSSIIQT